MKNDDKNNREETEESMLEKTLLSQETPPLPDLFESRLMAKARLLVAEKKQRTSFWEKNLIALRDMWSFFTAESRPVLAAALLMGILIGNQLTGIYPDSDFEDDYTEEFEIASRLDYFTATPVQSIHHFLLSGEYDETE